MGRWQVIALSALLMRLAGLRRSWKQLTLTVRILHIPISNVSATQRLTESPVPLGARGRSCALRIAHLTDAERLLTRPRLMRPGIFLSVITKSSRFHQE